MRLIDAITAYVDLKQSMGMKFRGAHAILKAFQRQTGDVDVAAVSPEIIAAFLQPRGPITATWLHKQRTVGLFYQHWITRGLVPQSPVPTTVPRVPETFIPHIYSDEELRRLLAGVAANQTRKGCTIAGPTFRVFLLLLYGTGLRFAEALALRREDVDLGTRMILIHDTKFYKARHLPIGPHLTQVLAEYVEAVPTRRGPAPTAFFLNRGGGPIPQQTVWANFDSLRARVGVQGRVHDLRHTFAVHRLLAWYREGADVQRCLPHLSTYLGHARIASTQRYLTMIPDLLEQASRRFETYAQSEVGHE
jgi:site-specific recombinase XerD